MNDDLKRLMRQASGTVAGAAGAGAERAAVVAYLRAQAHELVAKRARSADVRANGLFAAARDIERGKHR